MSRIILGIDPSTVSTGWAVMNEEEHLMGYGTIKGSSKVPIYQRVYAVYVALLQVADTYKITEIAIEDQFMGNNPKTLKSLSNVKATAMLIAGQYDIPYTEYTPKHVKVTFTGDGNATKERMIETAKTCYHINEEIDDNTADAIGIAYTQFVEGAR